VFVSLVIARVRAYLRYRASVRALSQLTDRELADIGIVRGNIASAARDAVAA
jgi:uncharacterized protein YjiS (DUF1127 family)